MIKELKIKLKNKKQNILCVILAGGKGSRLDNKGKFAEKLLNMSLLEHVYNRIIRQTNLVAINFKKNCPKNFNLNAKTIYDYFKEDIGPLAGIHSALKYASLPQFGSNNLVCTVPVDTPFIPLDLIEKLQQEFDPKKDDLVVSKSNNRIHPTIALWKSSLLIKLEKSINNNIRKIDLFTKDLSIATAEWECRIYDPFLNINNYEDLKTAENMIIKKIFN